MSSPRAPGSTSTLRTDNQRRVLDVLRVSAGHALDRPQWTQAELARTTGLAPATVSNIVRTLSDAGLVETDPGAGRRGTVVRLASSAGVVAGCDFGHSHVAVAIADLNGVVLGEQQQRLEPQHRHDDGLRTAAGMFEDLLTEVRRSRADVHAVGLGLPAPIRHGVVQSSAILPGWVGVDAIEAAGAAFGCAVHVDNDANLGALAEHRVGAARGHTESVYLKVSSGVGAGVIVRDRVFHGAGGTAGEIGHLTVDEQGPLCRCGSRGCLETYASSSAILAITAGPLPGQDLAGIITAARAGNVAALRALEDAGLHIGWGIASVVNLLNPGMVVVGGEVASAGDLVLDSVRVGLRRHALDAVANTPVEASPLGSRASLIGAALLAAESTDLAVSR